jgi:CDP-diacylglycerol---glycerol-3-phosphate 3-phosphatidyltransferase
LPDTDTPTLTLNREWTLFSALGVFLILLAASGLALLDTWQWTIVPGLLGSLLCWTYVSWQSWQRLRLNYDPHTGTHYHTLGAGTQITLIRGLLIAAAAGFVPVATAIADSVWMFIPAMLYTAAAIGDALDGYLARRQQHITRLGTELDTILDALGLLIAPVLAVLSGKLHVSYLLVSLAYYLFKLGISWRQRQGKPIHPLPPSKLRRQLAGWQMALVATALWPPIPGNITQVLGMLFMLPLLAGFGRDWLAVSGRRP